MFHAIAELHRVFVYGSLLAGFGNHTTFLGDAVFVKAVKTDEQAFDMVSLSYFPGVFRSAPNGEGLDVEGELYLVDDEQLFALDSLEGNGTMYKRELVWLEGEETPAWMYLYLNPQRAAAAPGRDYRVERTDETVRWLPDPNPPVYPRFNSASVFAKWGKLPSQKDTSEEIEVDSDVEDDVDWFTPEEAAAETQTADSGDDFAAMLEWLSKP